MSQRYIGGLIYNPPGGFSGYFDGSGDWLSLSDSAAWNMGSGDFTAEAWIYPTSFANEAMIMGQWSGDLGGTGLNWALMLSSGSTGHLRLITSSNGSGVLFDLSTSSTSFTLSLNTWQHIAAVRNGNTYTIYVNGVSRATTTNSSALYDATNAFTIGAESNTQAQYFTGYISNLRVVKGTAVYTAAFDPPVGPLQAITNTSLLTCAYPTFRDGSSNNFTITVNGNTAVSTQNPFPLTALPNPNLGNQGNGVYTMSQYQALRSQNLWPAIDPYWEYVTLMLHGNGTNGAQNNTFLDSSTNNFTITRNGNTTQGAFSPYGDNWSNYFDGSGDYLVGPTNNAFNFGTGDFTVEAWIYLAALPAPNVDGSRVGAICAYTGGAVAANQGFEFFINSTGNQLTFASWGTGNALVCSFTAAIGTWYHIAVTRSSGVGRLFVNGVSQTLTTNTLQTNTDADATIRIGTSRGDTGYNHDFPGYISNLRIVKGTAVYTSAFTPPTAPLTAITNTSLLTCQSNRFIDNSTNNFTITRNGDVSVQRFSPFHPTAPYAAGTIGGSGYFDGSGDYLSAATNTAFNCGTGNFTIEAWVNIANYPGSYPLIIGNNNGSFSAGALALTAQNSTSGGASKISLAAYDINSGAVTLAAGATNTLNSWIHVALVRNGTSLVLYINGASSASTTISAGVTFDWGKSGLLVGGGNWDGANSYFAGYINDLRLVKGTAVYTSAFTPPTAPLTAITNTSLLLNFTNAGIIDNAMMNDLETVGNAQISTSVSKFGGGSLAFDGTDDRLTAPASPNLAFNAGDFTVEGWIYTGSTGNLGVFQISGTAGGLQANQTNNTAVYCNNLVLGAYYGGTYKTGTTPIVANTWTHFALVRSSSVTRLYVNGVLDSGFGSNSDTQNYTGQNICVGGYFGTSNLFNGNIDDFRVTRGYARYTANFTPQRSQWQDQ